MSGTQFFWPRQLLEWLKNKKENGNQQKEFHCARKSFLAKILKIRTLRFQGLWRVLTKSPTVQWPEREAMKWLTREVRKKVMQS